MKSSQTYISLPKTRLGVIVGFNRQLVQKICIGIKGGSPYANHPKCGGYENGVGALSFYPQNPLNVVWKDENGRIDGMDVYAYVKSKAKCKITKSFISKLIALNKGNKVDLIHTVGGWVLKNLNQIRIP